MAAKTKAKTTPACRSRWYILAALLGTLATLAVIAGISISLAPAHISFSIARGGKIISLENDGWNDYYNFTVLASNSNSSRAAVRYGSLDVQIWYNPTQWVPAEANVTGELQHAQQPGGDELRFPILAEYYEYNQVETTTTTTANNNGSTNNTGANNSVVVAAKVWFRFRMLTTRQYTIRVSCYPVDFSLDTGTAPVSCTI